MRIIKIVTIVGARPQFIKAATLSRTIRKHNSIDKIYIDEIIVHTGQHYDSNMSDIFFDELDIPKPKYNLQISNNEHGAMTGKMIQEIEIILLKERPNYILVYGDTNSTLAGAIAASKIQIPIIHIEAGLRSYNPEMPEELNRIITDRLSSFLFCPTNVSINNLMKEGFPYILNKTHGLQEICNCGDIMYETILYYKKLATERISLSKWNLVEKSYVLCTIHRAENTNDKNNLSSILDAISEIAENIKVLLPLHPRTKKFLKLSNLEISKNIIVTDPLSYLEIQRLQIGAIKIITDSGGIQKEAYFHKVPCITLRNETEWTETVESNCNVLVGCDKNKIIHEFYNKDLIPNFNNELYGNGKTSMTIIDSILKINI